MDTTAAIIPMVRRTKTIDEHTLHEPSRGDPTQTGAF
jgi:hypothetical protein